MSNTWLFLTPTYLLIQVNCLRPQQQLDGGLDVRITQCLRRLDSLLEINSEVFTNEMT